jgi:diadenosine tetraphosphate (Ap4A) HIT family hydrolase
MQCPFCDLDDGRIIFESKLSILIRDAFPVSEGHSLIIPKRHVQSFFELKENEKHDLLEVLEIGKHNIERYIIPDSYNVGINNGIAAGQTIPHTHIHLIPRFTGDVKDPRGGIRWLIPEKANYWK